MSLLLLHLGMTQPNAFSPCHDPYTVVARQAGSGEGRTSLLTLAASGETWPAQDSYKPRAERLRCKCQRPDDTNWGRLNSRRRSRQTGQPKESQRVGNHTYHKSHV